MQRIKLADRKLPDYTQGEEIFNMVTHIVGGVLGIVATVLCAVKAALGGNAYGVVGGTIYGAAMILLYTMSSVYHGLSPRLTAKKVFQIIDHCTIFILIAGTYTPVALVSLREYNPALGWTIFGVIWGMAALGITLNAIDLKKYEKFSMICYLVMGWCIIATAKQALNAVGLSGMLYILIGGVLYTVGAVFYMNGRKKRYIHSVFHLFVVAGSLMQFFGILFYVM